jgi:hypothetical protein
MTVCINHAWFYDIISKGRDYRVGQICAVCGYERERAGNEEEAEL